MRTATAKRPKTRSELFLETSVKNMRSALSNLTMEQFVMQNMQTLFGLEREEYLDYHTSGEDSNRMA